MNHGDSCYGHGDFGLVTSRMLFIVFCLSSIVSRLLLLCQYLLQLQNKNELQTCFQMYYIIANENLLYAKVSPEPPPLK